MYTLEDDHETSKSLHKHDFGKVPAASGNADMESPWATAMPTVPRKKRPYVLALRHRSFNTHVKDAFKKLTTSARVALGDPISGTGNTTPSGGKGVAMAALTIACISVFFTALDQTVVVTALPQIITDLQIPITQIDHASWIISAYLLGFIIAMPLMGRVSDIYGRRRIFLLCLSIFGIGSIFCGLAPILGDQVDLGFLSVLHIDTSTPGLIWLIAARLIQAIGGGAVVPVAMAIAGDFYGKERRGLALGIVGAVTEAGGVLGPLYGALIVQHFGWQWIFFLNVPIVIGLIAAAWFLIPKGKHLREGIDWIGAILLGLALTCLSLGLAQQGTSLGPTATGAAPQNNPLSLALALIFLIAFILVERKVRWPVVDLSLFKRLPFSATSMVSLLVGAALIIAMVDIPIFVDTVLQRPVLDSGLALLRLTAMIPVGALLGGWLCSRISCRFTGAVGLVFTAAGFYLMSLWPVDVGWTQITISTVIAGLGFGLVIAPIGTTAINAVKATQAGMGSAVVTSLRMVGMMLGLAALTSWALAYFKQLASTYQSLPTTATEEQTAQWTKGYAHHLILSAHTVYSAVFFTSMILCLIAIVPAIFLWGRKLPQDAQEGTENVPASVTPLDQAGTENVPASGIPLDQEGTEKVSASVTPLDQQGTENVPASVTPLDAVAVAEATTLPLPLPVAVETTQVLPATVPMAASPSPPTPGSGGNGWHNWRNMQHWRSALKNRRRLLIVIISAALVVLLLSLGIFAVLTGPSPATTNAPSGAVGPGTPTPISGPRMIQLALDQTALTTLFTSELNLKQGALTDVQLTPTPNDGLVLSLNLHIDTKGIHRVLPVELDTTIGIDNAQNIQLHVLHLKRDGLDADATAAASMEKAVNQLLLNSIMPSLRGRLKSAKLISVHTSAAIGCSNGAEMLVLLILAPPIQGIAAQPTPTALCLKGPIDVNNLL